MKPKFEFSVEFQLEILRYIVRDVEGALCLDRVKPNYLTLISHSIIAEGLHRFFKKRKRIPTKVILKERVKSLLERREYVDLVTKDDITEINQLIEDIYEGSPSKDGDIIKEKIYEFSTYVEMRNLNESFDLDDFNSYKEYHKKISKILQNSEPSKEEEPLMMVKGVVKRQLQRQSSPEVIPTPFKQLNDLTNGGGYEKASVVVLLDKAKAKKTFTMLNVARGYLRMKRSVLYIDTENGKTQIMGRMIQSTLNKTKKDINSGEFDKLEKDHMRKYKRLGVEFIVERAIAMADTCEFIRDKITSLRNAGIDIRVLVVDYAGKLASTSKKSDDFERINDVYIELQNLAQDLQLDAVWTAHHVTRDGSKRKETRYEESDISGSIAIVRNAQAVIGLNSTSDEEDNNIQRMEIVVQRDGKPSGRALFNIDVERQRMTEFTNKQRTLYDEKYGSKLDSEFNKNRGRNPNAKEVDPNKHGDI